MAEKRSQRAAYGARRSVEGIATIALGPREIRGVEFASVIAKPAKSSDSGSDDITAA